MDIITIVSIMAASITIMSALYYAGKRIRGMFKALDERLVAIEDNFKIREELILTEDIVVMNENNSRLYTLSEGQRIIVYDVQDDMVYFVTSDRLIKSHSNIKNFKQENDE